MKMCPLTRSAEQTAGAKCSESCEWWLEEQEACVERAKALAEFRIANSLGRIAEYLEPIIARMNHPLVVYKDGDDDAKLKVFPELVNAALRVVNSWGSVPKRAEAIHDLSQALIKAGMENVGEKGDDDAD